MVKILGKQSRIIKIIKKVKVLTFGGRGDRIDQMT